MGLDGDIEKWRRMYEIAAGQPNWIRAHRWGYSEEVARLTIGDIRDKLKIQPSDRALDVGCGSGAVLGALLHEGQSAVGVDLCETLLRKAGAFSVDRRHVRLMVAEAARLPFRSETFDGVLCYSIFQCFPSPLYAEDVFKELVRVCKAGGVVLIGDLFGAVEQFRETWRREGWGMSLVRSAFELPGLRPFYHVLWRLRKGFALTRGWSNSFERKSEEPAVDRRHYTQRFFRRLGRKHRVRVEILPQQIPGRGVSHLRFDVRLTKIGDQSALSSL